MPVGKNIAHPRRAAQASATWAACAKFARSGANPPLLRPGRSNSAGSPLPGALERPVQCETSRATLPF